MEHKIERLMQTALAEGWKAQIKTDIPEDMDVSQIIWDLYCVRKQETMHVQYLGNAMQEGRYTYGKHYSLYPTHKAAVENILTSTPDPRNLRIKVEDIHEELEELRSVPWVADSPAIEIMRAVIGKDIIWVRKLDGQICRGTVSKHSNLGSRYFRVYHSPPDSDQRTLDWVDLEGFHSVRLDSIVEVS